MIIRRTHRNAIGHRVDVDRSHRKIAATVCQCPSHWRSGKQIGHVDPERCSPKSTGRKKGDGSGGGSYMTPSPFSRTSLNITSRCNMNGTEERSKPKFVRHASTLVRPI